MGKSNANMYRYAQVSKASNQRYVKALSVTESTEESIKEIEKLCDKVEVNDKPYSVLN